MRGDLMQNVATTILVGLLSFVWLRVYNNVKESYMDELFHVRQAQQYCRGNYSAWDDKITTFPGLYVVSSLVHSVWRALTNSSTRECSLFYLRSTSIFFVFVLFFAAMLCRRSILHQHRLKIEHRGQYIERHDDSHLSALLIAVYPISAFYYLLYYTDTASTSTLLLSYLASIYFLEQYQVLSVVLSSASIAMRQTNAIWVLFFAGTSMLSQLERDKLISQDNGRLLSLRSIANFVAALLQNLPTLLYKNSGLLFSVTWFAVFVVYNGGIVVGDEQHHQPVLHMAMPLHLMAIAVAVAAPSILVEELLSFRSAPTSTFPTVRSLLLHCTGVAVVTATLYFGVLDHPFLLGDNRHYSFYVWNRILQRRSYRLLLGPIYYVCCQLFVRRLERGNRGPLWITIYFLAVSMTLIPAHLLEPRYFTPGIVVFLLNGPDPVSAPALQKLAVASSILVCVVVNVATMYVFLERPFRWPDGSVARFMY